MYREGGKREWGTSLGKAGTAVDDKRKKGRRKKANRIEGGWEKKKNGREVKAEGVRIGVQ